MIDISNVFPDWKVIEYLGRGNKGDVYLIEKDMFELKEAAILKHIVVPRNDDELQYYYDDGFEEASIKDIIEGQVSKIVKEYSIMRNLSDCTNIVKCDEIKVQKHENDLSYEIFIKMEYLKPLARYISLDVEENEIIKIACDLCNALSYLEKEKMVHRDINPNNIFVSEEGVTKIGDSGFAKFLEMDDKSIATCFGHLSFAAPEIYRNEPCGFNFDIYSVGIVLYWLLNKRRLPFMPPHPEKVSANDSNRAFERRMDGEALPRPLKGSDELVRIILKACAFNPENRYQTADEMLFDLIHMSDERV